MITKVLGEITLRIESNRINKADSPTIMYSFYSKDGGRIGNIKLITNLVQDRGIIPQRISKKYKVCSIGKSLKDGKWYGWSHRAIYGFKIGDVVRKGNCHAGILPIGFKAKTEKDCKKMAIAFAKSVS